MKARHGLRDNFNNLMEKHVKMMDNMTMEDVGFQQRVLLRMMEITQKKKDEISQSEY